METVGICSGSIGDRGHLLFNMLIYWYVWFWILFFHYFFDCLLDRWPFNLLKGTRAAGHRGSVYPFGRFRSRVALCGKKFFYVCFSFSFSFSWIFLLPTFAWKYTICNFCSVVLVRNPIFGCKRESELRVRKWKNLLKTMVLCVSRCAGNAFK